MCHVEKHACLTSAVAVIYEAIQWKMCNMRMKRNGNWLAIIYEQLSVSKIWSHSRAGLCHLTFTKKRNLSD